MRSSMGHVIGHVTALVTVGDDVERDGELR
jgi:hypothetical protein